MILLEKLTQPGPFSLSAVLLSAMISSLLLLPMDSHAQSNSGENYSIHEGELNGAPYKVAVPENWQDGNLFFHLHGWRPADAPHEANLNPENPFYRELLEMGWAVARTAYYENGVDNEAHIRAITELRGWIDSELGTVGRVILEGESTAGSLVLRIAEIEPGLADGVIAKGAFVNIHDEDADSYLEGTPKIPAILMSNLTELDEPVAYTAISEDADVRPALRPLLRPGHVNVNWVERLDAFNDLNNWISSGTVSLISEGTRSVPVRETNTTVDDGELINRVEETDPYFGNAILGFHPVELGDIGIFPGDYFILETGDASFEIFYGDSYGDVAEGEWVAFPTADDRILVARNFENAVETAGFSRGDRVVIRWIGE
ncbi:hypothetical protein DYD21_00560 [Rhodohalobacter sp. SW132]|uniref:hypothetical protein n=1 Tax=Rhodohalobacter sp. SW132 TaxID=2293433 RepID=UPI000E240976|nr:hypothetical protein [Rhodohalobacter sp. SW132]REL38476.1 hypothetical protein DYD21_00560 [Rhodohalobacter sp. SW132]